MKEAIIREGEFNFIHGESGIKIDFWVAGNNPTTRLEISRRIPKKIDSQTVYFISPEDLILSKLRWYKDSESTRHLEDIKSVFNISKIDLKYLKREAANQSILNILVNLLKEK